MRQAVLQPAAFVIPSRKRFSVRTFDIRPQVSRSRPYRNPESVRNFSRQKSLRRIVYFNVHNLRTPAVLKKQCVRQVPENAIGRFDTSNHIKADTNSFRRFTHDRRTNDRRHRTPPQNRKQGDRGKNYRIRNFCPIRSVVVGWMPFRSQIFLTVTPYRIASLPSMSPERTVW